jgi:hypothetical protein
MEFTGGISISLFIPTSYFADGMCPVPLNCCGQSSTYLPTLIFVQYVDTREDRGEGKTRRMT